MWLRWFEPLMVKVRRGPNWASIGLAQEALVGVKHSSTLFFLAQARMGAVLLADRLSRFCCRPRYVADAPESRGSQGSARQRRHIIIQSDDSQLSSV